MVLPLFVNSCIKKVDYSTFLNRLNSGSIDTVQVRESQIYFTSKVEIEQTTQVYSTTVFNDPSLVDRLLVARCKFGSVATKEQNPYMALILGWSIPFIIFVFLGRYLSKKLQGGSSGLGGAIKFGKSNAKVYVPS